MGWAVKKLMVSKNGRWGISSNIRTTTFLFLLKAIVKNQLLGIINRDMDSIRIYNLGNKYSSKIEQHGRKESYDPEGNLILWWCEVYVVYKF